MRSEDAPLPDGGETRMVLLEHSTPDGDRHFDWLIERPGVPDEHRLIALRCAHDPLCCLPIEAERLPDHRARYLDYEGPIGGGRGSVRRVWRRACELRVEGGDRFEVSLGRGGDARRLIAEAVDGDLWRVRAG